LPLQCLCIFPINILLLFWPREMDGQPQQKKRKWDVPGPASAPAAASATVTLSHSVGIGSVRVNPAPAVDIALAQAAAAALFNKYHPGSQAKAIPAPAPPAASIPESKPSDLSREVFINDAPTGVRIHLTKRGVQDEIQARTNTIIVTRGRYYPPGAVPDGKEKPLHLLVKPGAQAGATEEQKQQAVSNAVSDIQRILQGMPVHHRPPPAHQQHTAPPPPAAPSYGTAPHAQHHPAPSFGAPPPIVHPPPYGAPPPGYGYPQPSAPPPYHHQAPPTATGAPPAAAVGAPASAPPTASASHSCVIYTGITQPGPYPVAEKIKGPGGSFLQHVANTTGATVQLRGRGSGDAEG
ncbi:hypothetical protein Vretifemale_653, partial [Volvox reticuliferus]